MRALHIRVTALCILAILAACEQDPRSKGGVFLPPGDAAKGEALFVSLGCVGCHSVVGAELPQPATTGPVNVLIGTRTGRILSYGELVTSIVNPSHRLATRYPKAEVSKEGESLMTVYNDVMTVTQLTHLIAFLQAHYDKSDRPGYRFPVYKYEVD